ncbi:hypothetical protein Rleg9DRAFT_1725 [Rhizobium leguminosarum bv. trifolii WSM597]|uniref:Uncharacterized protein n=1 Tax=Rhizobium leguminosarum bv. trifolii WSM597 TaxID=754764 RepID=I9X2H6_RHILT|nr:hypothetical protein [Rhizobium leguminosarum]EJB02911.1 hypothetical protein Rleg9DRAFT_1725 [Rhizobium leguminosarum bv. trifolii WSM597]
MRTSFPWFRHGRILVGAKNGVPDLKRLVATFVNEDDAKTISDLLAMRDELLTTLRVDLQLLEDELKNLRFSGVPQYIEPVETAVKRTIKAIALAEGWGSAP